MKKYLPYLLVIFIGFNTNAQQKQLSLEDAVLGYYRGLYPKSLRNLQWVQNSENFLCHKDEKIQIQNASNQNIKEIGLDEFQQVFPDKKRLPYIEAATPEYLMFSEETGKVLYDYHRQKAQTIKYPKEAQNIDFNTKSKTLAYTIDNNLYLADAKTSKIPITANENKNIVSGQAIARSEFGITKGTFWSPSGNKLAFYQKDETNVADYPLVDITVTPAKLKNIKYPMNGLGSEEPGLGIYDLKTKKSVYLQLFIRAGKNHYITNLTWGPNEKYVYLAEVNRDQNHIWFNKYRTSTGRFVQTLFEEQNKKWAEPEHPAFFIPNKKNEFIWLSERDGYMNLYKYDTKGKLIKQLTHNEWVTNDILGFSDKGRYVYLSGTGKDAREEHLFRVDTKKGNIRIVTPKTGYHSLMLSDNGKYYLDIFSNTDTPGIVALGHTSGKHQVELFKAENPLKNYRLPQPEMLSIKGEYGDNLYARMFKPVDFNPEKKYPVLIYVYNGPHVQLIQNRWLGAASLWMLWLANQGYIVFTVDGHGSDNRGFAFESVIYRQLGVVEMKDQLHGVAYLKSLPYVDDKRIAVHGWSFGGFMTCSLMTTYPEVFTTGVAGGPVTDWKWYEVMYGERYMDTKEQNPEGFKKTSVINKIKNLKGKLLTIHGYQDDVVVPQHDLALQREAIKNGIQMDFYLYPTHPHNVYGKDRLHLMRKVLDYIMQNNK